MKETRLKLLQYITGVGLLVLAGVHVIYLHLVKDDADEWKSVAERAADFGWVIFYLALIAFGLYHGLHGLRTIILEWFSVADDKVKYLDTLLVMVGIAILTYAAFIPLNAY
jgi:succinate dehydrogenase hydrophobic anchor subunit